MVAEINIRRFDDIKQLKEKRSEFPTLFLFFFYFSG